MPPVRVIVQAGRVLNAMPTSLLAKAKGHFHDIWQAETKAAAKLCKDRDVLLAFYDFPAKHWKHDRTTNPIESPFATVRHRISKTKGCLSRKTGRAMAFKLMMSAQGKWPKLDGSNRMPESIRDGTLSFAAVIKAFADLLTSKWNATGHSVWRNP